jgi:hypothetical protein
LFVLAVMPITMLAAAAATRFSWPWSAVVAVSAFDLAMGTVLIECVLVGWNIVPFACAHEPDQAALRSRWLLYLIPLNVFAFRGAAWQASALSSVPASLLLLASVMAIALIVRRVRLRRARRDPVLFDTPVDERLEVLNLSEALR